MNSSFEYDEFEFRKEIFELVNGSIIQGVLCFQSLLPAQQSLITCSETCAFLPVAIGLCIFLLKLSFRLDRRISPFVCGWIFNYLDFGVMGWLDMSLDFIGTLIPVMLVFIANNYGIHIISHYLSIPEMIQGYKEDKS